MSSNNPFDALSSKSDTDTEPDTDTDTESATDTENESENIEGANGENNEVGWTMVQSKKSNKHNIDTIDENNEEMNYDKIKKLLIHLLEKIYIKDLELDIKNKNVFNFFVDTNKDIFEIFTEENINNFLTNYNETKNILKYSNWKDITYLYKLDKEYRNKYIYNLLTLEQKELFKESLKVIEDKYNIKNTNNFEFINFNDLNINNNDVLNYGITHTLKIVYKLLYNDDKKLEDNINNILSDGFQFPDNFGIVLNNKNEINSLLELNVEYYDINLEQTEIKLKDFIYYTFVYILLLYYIDENMDLADYFKNENIGMASNINEYNYDDYIKITELLSTNFQTYISENNPNSKLIKNRKEQYVGGNFDPHFVNENILPLCVDEVDLTDIDLTDINNIDIEKFYTKNVDFRVNNMWFDEFNKMPCMENKQIIEEKYIFPHFTKSIVRRDINDIKLLDTEIDINNNYLKWYYRPNILGSTKYDFMNMNTYISIDNYNLYDSYIKKIEDIKSKYPYFYTIYYNKLWLQLQCYNTTPNGFLNQILNKSENNINNNNFYDKYKNMPITLTHLFSFLISIYVNINNEKTNNEKTYNYNILNLDTDQYYTIENITDYDYLGYIYIPFKKDTRNLNTNVRLSKGRPHNTANLTYFIFKHKENNKIVISNHRNKIYLFHQKETPQCLTFELNIIGYLNKWNKKYEEWTLYPYLVIYNPNYKYYNNLYTLDPDPNYRTHIYISTLKYDELLLKQDELNNRMYNNNNNYNINNKNPEQNLKIQLNIPTQQDELNEPNTHMFIIPIIPILMHKTIKFICPNQTEYNIKDYQTFLINKSNNIIQQGGKTTKSKYFYKYIKYKLKYMNLIYEKEKFQN